MSIFTTQDIITILGIERPRLKGWIADTPGFFEPTKKSPGPGKSAEYSIDDIYCFALFQYLTETTDLKRKTAAEIISQIRLSEQAKDRYTNVDVITVVNARSKKLTATKVLWATAKNKPIPLKIPDPKLVPIENTFDVIDADPEKFWSDILIINVYKIRMTIEPKIKVLEAAEAN